MVIRVTRAQLRKLRGSLRDGRSLAIRIQPQLLAAYRSTSADREQLTRVNTSAETTANGFQLIIGAPATKEKKKTRKVVRREAKKKVTRNNRHVPTQILGRRSSPGDAARERQEKSRVVTVHDLAAQVPVTTVRKEPPSIGPNHLRLLSSALLRAVVDLMR